MPVCRPVSPLVPTLASWLAAAALAGCADLPPYSALRIATASSSQVACTAAFVSGLDPQQAFDDEMRPAPGMGLVAWAFHLEVDTAHQEVRANIGGIAPGRAVYRPGLGCTVLPEGAQLSAALPAALPTGSPGGLAQDPATRPVLAWPTDPFPSLAAPGPQPAADPALQALLDAMFVEPEAPPWRRTQAVLVLHRGQLLAERYAPGVGPDTPLPGHSLSKSLVHALIGRLVQQGRLDPDAPLAPPSLPHGVQPAPSANALLANASGLPWDEAARGWDNATRMWYLSPDPAAFAAQQRPTAAPGTQFAYSNAGWTLLSRQIRDLAGGTAPATLAWAQHALLAPLGMRHTELGFDASDTPLGAHQFSASARDWARLGQLYLQDGVVAGQRLLPEGWVQQARTPTLDAGYGRGWWLNHRHDAHPFPGRWGLPGAPADTFFGRGYLGQFIVVVPSRQLVLVRLGISHRDRGDVQAVGQLVQQVLTRLPV